MMDDVFLAHPQSETMAVSIVSVAGKCWIVPHRCWLGQQGRPSQFEAGCWDRLFQNEAGCWDRSFQAGAVECWLKDHVSM